MSNLQFEFNCKDAPFRDCFRRKNVQLGFYLNLSFMNTQYFYNNEPSKNKHFLILLSSLARNSQEPKLKVFWPKIFLAERHFLEMTFTKNIPNMYQGPSIPGFRLVRVEN